MQLYNCSEPSTVILTNIYNKYYCFCFALNTLYCTQHYALIQTILFNNALQCLKCFIQFSCNLIESFPQTLIFQLLYLCNQMPFNFDISYY